MRREWANWFWHIRNRIQDIRSLEKWIHLSREEREAIHYASTGLGLRMAITPHFASIMDKENPQCPIRRQAIPSLEELEEGENDLNDPCGEEEDTVVPGLVHRYPDRVLFLMTDACAMYCRHCTRKRMVGEKEETLSAEKQEKIYQYIEANSQIRDVLISGGDPLMLSDGKLEEVLCRLRKIPHVEIIRIGSRIPVTLPQRITKNLAKLLKRFHPLYMSIHFNHPVEITEATIQACERLADAGIPMGSQTVLLKGINDSPEVMKTLMHKLLMIRVKPYYIYQCDLARGTEHFRTPVSMGIRIIESLRGHTSGYAVPAFVIDAPGGGGKVPLNPETIISRTKKEFIIRNWKNEIFIYPQNRIADDKLVKIHIKERR